MKVEHVQTIDEAELYLEELLECYNEGLENIQTTQERILELLRHLSKGSKATRPPDCPVSDEIKELQREQVMRKEVYPNLIRNSKLKRSEANRRYQLVNSTIRRLKRIQEQNHGTQAEIFATK